MCPNLGLDTWVVLITTHGLTHFVVSVSPANAASLALIAQMGFRRIGAHIDPEDGPEDIFEFNLTAARPLLRGGPPIPPA